MQQGAFSSRAFAFKLYWDHLHSLSSRAEHPTEDLLHVLQGRNCEHNYDDCLVNPCPEGFSCIDGINEVSCLPPVADNVLLEAAVRNMSYARDPVFVAELSTGIMNERNVEKLSKILIFWTFIANNRERKSSTINSLMKFLFLTGFRLADVLLVCESTDRSQSDFD